MTPLNSRDLTEAVKIDIETGLVPKIGGSPGIGKSALIKDIGKQADLVVKVEHMSMMEPTDINGYPDVGGEYARFKTFENFPTEGMKVPAGTNGWLLFLDEINSASIETQAACYSLILDRKVGDRRLHPQCYVVAAGNLRTDNAIVNTQSSAMTSRMVNYEMRFDPTIFLEDVVARYDWEYRVAAYLEWKPEHCHVFDPNKAEDPYACPRTWDMQQQRMKTQAAIQWTDNQNNPQVGFNYEATHNRASAEGLVGTELGREFITFCRTFGQIPTTKAVINDPTGIAVPNSRGLQFALVVQLRKDVDHITLQDIYQFVERLDPEFRVTFLRGALADPTKQISRSHPVIVDAQRNLRRRPNP
jgi:hypothetical protein